MGTPLWSFLFINFDLNRSTTRVLIEDAFDGFVLGATAAIAGVTAAADIAEVRAF